MMYQIFAIVGIIGSVICTAFLFFWNRRKKVMVYDKVKCKIASDGGVAEQGSPKELLEKNGVLPKW